MGRIEKTRTTEVLFRERLDFVDAMNRIYFLSRKYRIVILAFCLMDNHIHLIIYGLFEECNRFVHELVRQISSAIARRHGLRHELQTIPDLDLDSMEDLSGERRRELFRTREPIPDDLKVYGGCGVPRRVNLPPEPPGRRDEAAQTGITQRTLRTGELPGAQHAAAHTSGQRD